ncbi:hypothetical protein Tco_1248641 [Tanacetum coccineum]
MASSIQKGKYFNPHEVKNDDSHALEQRTIHYSKESINIVDYSDDSQEDEVGSHLSKDAVSRWHVCKLFRQSVGGNGMKFADFLKVRYGNKKILGVRNSCNDELRNG